MKTLCANIATLRETILMILFTYAKIFVLYLFTIAPENILTASLRTLILLIMIYLIVNLTLFGNNFAARLIFHEVFGFMLLAEIIYFKYFNSLPSITDLSLISLLPSIWESVEQLLHPKYLIAFADAALLMIVHSRKRNDNKSILLRKRKAAIFSSILTAGIVLDILVGGCTSGYQVYNNFGILHYHANQIAGLVNKSYGFHESIEDKGNMNPQESKEAKLFGLAKGRNIIVVQVEALQDFVISMNYNGQEITPNLNKLIKGNSIYFDRYYQQLGKGNTSDAEFVTQHSVYPSMQTPSYRRYEGNSLVGLPRIFKDMGYETIAFHGYKGEFWNRKGIYPVLGFNKFISLEEFNLDEKIGWGLSDKSFFRQAAVYLKGSQQPFYSFLVTLTSHHPFVIPDSHKKISLKDEHNGTLLGNYLQTINYTDEAIGCFIENLKECGLYDNSIIAVYGDHLAINCNDKLDANLMTELLGYKYSYDEMLNVPLIMHIPNSGITRKNSIVGGQMDFLPTMLNLIGIKEEGPFFFGQDLNNAKSGFVASQTFMLKGSFIDDEKIYIMSQDGVFEHGEAWDLKTRQPLDIELCRANYERAVRDIEQSEYILSNDMIKEMYANSGGISMIGEAVETSDLTRILKELLLIITN